MGLSSDNELIMKESHKSSMNLSRSPGEIQAILVRKVVEELLSRRKGASP